MKYSDHLLKEQSIEDFLRLQIFEIQQGLCAVFCGAGVSIHSGLPSAIDLISHILEKLSLSHKEAEIILNSKYPFEAFFEVLNANSEIERLLEIFSSGKPNTNHVLLAKLAKMGYIETICTTNFDTLVEQALALEGLKRGYDYNVFYTKEHFQSLTWAQGIIRVIKLHGSIDDKETVAIALSQVATRKPLQEQSEILRQIFSIGSHKSVIILGYSCSDIFDISPQIEAIGNNYKSIRIVEHTSTPAHWGIESINLKSVNSPFQNVERGSRIKIDTDVFVKKIWQGCLEDTYIYSQEKTFWQQQVENWIKEVEKRNDAAIFRIPIRLFENIGEFHHAIKRAKRALVVAQKSKDKIAQGRLSGDLGRLHNIFGKYEEAIKYHKAALLIAEEIGNETGQAAELGNLGNVYHNLGLFHTAVDYQQSALLISQQIGNKLLEGNTFGNLGLSYRNLEEYELAITCHQNAITIAREIGNKLGESRQLGNLGLCYKHLEQYEKGKLCHEEALRLQVILGEKRAQGLSLGNIGEIYYCTGDHKNALRYFHLALEIAIATGDRKGESIQLANLAESYLAICKYKKAKRFAEQSLKVAREIKARQSEAISLSILARICSAMEDYQSSIIHGELAWTMFNSLLGANHKYTKAAKRAVELSNQNLINLK